MYSQKVKDGRIDSNKAKKKIQNSWRYGRKQNWPLQTGVQAEGLYNRLNITVDAFEMDAFWTISLPLIDVDYTGQQKEKFWKFVVKPYLILN